MSERWLPVPGYEGRFEVSDLGRVRSVARYVRSSRWKPDGRRLIASRILRTHTWGAKYPGIVLHDGRGGAERKMIHQLVAAVFLENPHKFPLINHLDGNKSNPQASNIEWTNQAGNMEHAHRAGLRPVGKDHHFAKMRRDSHGHCVAGGGWEVEEF